MTTDLLELDAVAADPWGAGVEDEDVYRCGCADCRALRGRGPARGERERDDG